MSALGLEVAHHLIDALLVLGFAEAGQVGVESGDHRTLVAEIDLKLTEVLTLLKEMGSITVAKCVRMGVFGDAARFQGQAKGFLQSGMGHGFARGGRALTIVTFAREEQSGMAMGFPLLPEQFQGALGQWHIAIAIAFTTADMQKHAIGVDIADL
jgi:hypothetical protein